MATRLGDLHRTGPSDHGKPYHEMDPVAKAISHQPGPTEGPGEATGRHWQNETPILAEYEDPSREELEAMRARIQEEADERDEMESALAEVARKFDQGKPPLTTIDPAFLLDLATVLQFGDNKYGRLNWQGLSVERLMDAHQRHTLAFLGGEELDPETGKPHLIHAASCLMMVNWIMKNRREQDDRRFKPSSG